MSKFTLLCADVTLWDPTTRATWGSLDFCPMITWFQVHAIMQTQLTTLSQAGAWGEIEKPQQDMAFLMIVPSTNAGGDQVFSLASPPRPLIHSGGGSPEADATGRWWPRLAICIHLHEWHHVACALSNKEHIGTMIDGVCSTNACSGLHQLQVWKLLQHSDSVVFTEGLNGELEALQFSFQSCHSGMPPLMMGPPEICPW